MRFDLSDEQRDIQSTARSFLESRFDRGTMAQENKADPYDEGVFDELKELGWLGLAVPEEYGGVGLGQVEQAVVQEAMGYALAAVPYTSSIWAGLMLTFAGSEAQKERWLPGLSEGTVRGTVAEARGGEPDEYVLDADSADFVILVEDGTASLLDRDAFSAERLSTLDLTRRYGTLTDVGDGEALPGDVEAALQRIYLTIAAESAGISRYSVDLAVAYAKDRKQFGRPIGSYQAVSHKCAEMFLDAESALNAVYFGAWAADAAPEQLPTAASAAKASAGDAAYQVTSAAMNIHGGIGYTWEHGLHLYLRRASLNVRLFGTPTRHRARIAQTEFGSSKTVVAWPVGSATHRCE